MARGLLRLAILFVGIATSLLTIPLVLGFLGFLHPLFDSLSHFRLHLAAAVAAGGLVLLAARGWRLNGALMLLLALAASAVTLWPAWVAEQAAAAHEQKDARSYRLLQLNLRFDNPQPDAAVSLISRELPDLVAMEEVSQQWGDLLRGSLTSEYPHRLLCPPGSYIGGIAFLSRHPLAHAADACLRSNRFLTAIVDLDGSPIQLAALHFGWPWPFGQDRQVQRLRPSLEAIGDNALLAGDFNATPWSLTVREVQLAGELSLGPWVGPSYLDRRLPKWLRPLVGLPIDHVMAKGAVMIDSVTRLHEVGSDHLPVLTTFHLAAGDSLHPPVQTVSASAR